MFKRGIRLIGANQKYLFLGLALFLLGSLMGFLNANVIQDMARDLLEQLEQIAKKMEDSGSPLYVFWVIFQNNVMASLTMLGLGVFFGIFPIFALLSNGLLLGYMLKTMSLQGINPFSVLALGILPHGVIEIFAVIVAAAIGIKYGMYMIRIIFSMANSGGRSRVLDEFKESLHELPYIVGSIIVLLFLAAVIESTITPLLIQNFIDLGKINV